MAKELYYEQQKFNQPLFLILIGVGAVPLIGILVTGINQQIIQGHPWGNKPMSDTGLLLVTFFTLILITGITLLFLFAKLETQVDRWEVRYRFAPLIPNWKTILKADIKEYKIIQYSFRGYGVRWGLDGIKTLNVKGKMGIQFLYGENKKIIIGTQQPDLFLAALDKMKDPELE